MCGLINGLIITRLGVTDFITTLATLSVFRGILFTMTQGVPFASFARPSFSWIGRGNLGPIPVPVLIAAGLFVILFYLLNKTAMGRHLLAIGSNREAARLSGVRVDRTKIWVYIVAGVTFSISGIMLASRLSSVPPDLGTGYELSVIAAVVIGGTSLFGGRGSIVGTVIGALMVAVIANGLILLDVNPFYQYVINGILIVFAVAHEQVRRKRLKSYLRTWSFIDQNNPKESDMKKRLVIGVLVFVCVALSVNAWAAGKKFRIGIAPPADSEFYQLIKKGINDGSQGFGGSEVAGSGRPSGR